MISIKNISIISCLVIFSITGALKQDLIDLEASLNQLLPKIQSTAKQSNIIPVITVNLDSVNSDLAASFIDFMNKNNARGFKFIKAPTVERAKFLIPNISYTDNSVALLPWNISTDRLESAAFQKAFNKLKDAGFAKVIAVAFRYSTNPSVINRHLGKDPEFGDVFSIVWADGKLLDTPDGLDFNKKSLDDLIKLIQK